MATALSPDQEIDVLQLLKDAESPFKWKAHEGSEKEPEDVIDTVEERLRLEPMFSAAYRVLLAAYHTKSKNRKCINIKKAMDYLREAQTLNQENRGAAGRHDQRFIDCTFLVESTWLCVEQRRDIRSKDFDMRVRKLSDAWNSDNEYERNLTRGNTFLVKTLALFHEGILKYDAALEAVKECLKHQPNNFFGLYLQAYMTARLRRHEENKSIAGEVELTLWDKAYTCADWKLAAKNESYEPYYYFFCATYAEAIFENTDKYLITKCQEMARSTSRYLHQINLSKRKILEDNYRIALICAKVFRIQHMKQMNSYETEQVWKDYWKKEEQKLFDILHPLADTTVNSQLLFDLAKDSEKRGDTYECGRLLLRAQQVAYEPGHIWVDVYLQKFRYHKRTCTYAQIEEEYDTLIEKYRNWPRYQAVSYYKKEVFLCCIRRHRKMEGFNNIVKAHEVFPDVRVHIFPQDRKRNLDGLKDIGRPECEAWFKQYIMDDKDKDKGFIENSYKQEVENGSEDRKHFAIEHLGIFYRDEGKLQEAEELFKCLLKEAPNHPRSNALLSSVFLKKAAKLDLTIEEKEELLFNALVLGSLEACEPALQVLTKRVDSVKFIGQRYSPPDLNEPVRNSVQWRFSRDTYELGALIHINSDNQKDRKEVKKLLVTDRNEHTQKMRETRLNATIAREKTMRWLRRKDILGQNSTAVTIPSGDASSAGSGRQLKSADGDRNKIMSEAFELARIEMGKSMDMFIEERKRCEPHQNDIVVALAEAKVLMEETFETAIADNNLLEKELHKAAVEILMNAKMMMDGSYQSFKASIGFTDSSEEFRYFPYGFTQICKPKDKIEEKVKTLANFTGRNIAKQITDRLESRFKKFKDPKNAVLDAKLDAVKDLQICREIKSLRDQSPWLVVWQEAANKAKHEMTDRVTYSDIVKKIVADPLNQHRHVNQPQLDAYDVAHLAAEFAEETRLTFTSDVGGLQALLNPSAPAGN